MKHERAKMSTKRIFIVDDEVDVLNLAKIILESEGYEIQTAQNGEKAFSEIIQTKPDLILLDILMPVMDGYETCQKLKEHSETAWIPIVMHSASDSEGTKERVRKAGADGFLLKPFTIDQLLNIVKEHLSKIR